MQRAVTVPVLAGLVLVLGACAPAGSVPPSASPDSVAPSDTPAGSSPSEPAATPSAATSHAPAPSEAAPDALLDTPLTDVRSGATFTLAALAASEGPVLLEPMAVWCSNCRAQQHEVKRAHDAGEFASVSLDVDLSETPEDLAAYADREGFDWRFAMADAALYRHLQERFGVAATNPPSTPLIVIEPDGTVRALEFGVGTRSAEQLIAEIGAG